LEVISLTDDYLAPIASAVGLGITIGVAGKVLDMIPRPPRTRRIVRRIRRKIHHRR
jgi:hypothetical protein